MSPRSPSLCKHNKQFWNHKKLPQLQWESVQQEDGSVNQSFGVIANRSNPYLKFRCGEVELLLNFVFRDNQVYYYPTAGFVVSGLGFGVGVVSGFGSGSGVS